MLSRATRGWTPTALVAPLIVAFGVFVLLAAFVSADPARGVTVSTSPFTDEAWDVLNARNFVLLGRWSTDDWNLYLVNLPYSLLAAVSFNVLGVGIVQARLVDIVVTALTAAVLLGGLRRQLGGAPALVASLGFAFSLLVLYYGRLAYLEPLVALALVGAALLAAPVSPRFAGPRGLLAGALLAVAIATKASAAFAAGGILLGLVVAGLAGWGAAGVPARAARLATLRWCAGAVLVMAAAGAAWWYLLARPDLAAVRADLRIWAPEPIPRSMAQLLDRIRLYPQQADGAVIDALPLLVGGGLGALVSVLRWRHLGAAARRLLLVGAGWFAVGWGVLLLVPYRPNRYVVPILPALAILTAVGLAALLAVLRADREAAAPAVAKADDTPDSADPVPDSTGPSRDSTGPSRDASGLAALAPDSTGPSLDSTGPAALAPDASGPSLGSTDFTADPLQPPGAAAQADAATLDDATPLVEAATAPGIPQSVERAAASPAAPFRQRPWLARLAAIALTSVVVLGLIIPGLFAYGSWMLSASHDLPATQARVRAILPAGAVVEGAYAPLLAMSAPVTTLVARPASDINAGDLYATRHVRWVVVHPDSTPIWASAHPGVWAGRRPVLCVPWGGVQLCLDRLP